MPLAEVELSRIQAHAQRVWVMNGRVRQVEEPDAGNPHVRFREGHGDDWSVRAMAAPDLVTHSSHMPTRR
jgi:hypothetical protein